MTPRFYILMNCDLEDMNPGKGMAQAAHAASLFAARVKHMQAFPRNAHDVRVVQQYNEWMDDYGFGTKVVLEATADEVRHYVGTAESIGLESCLVIDPSYPKLVGYDAFGPVIEKVVQMTCGYVFSPTGHLPLLQDLELHP